LSEKQEPKVISVLNLTTHVAKPHGFVVCICAVGCCCEFGKCKNKIKETFASFIVAKEWQIWLRHKALVFLFKVVYTKSK
jgi:hypothetical protein